MNAFSKVFSTFFGIGFFPIAPGTLASLLAALLYRGASSLSTPLSTAGIVAGLFFLGAAASGAYARELGLEDPGVIVIDEVVGQILALSLAPAGWKWTAAGFFIFRFFDIFKPFPVRLAERLPWGWGIMADDILAALYTALLLRAWTWIR
jgi:phosphatidylglycerophosphatase A